MEKLKSPTCHEFIDELVRLDIVSSDNLRQIRGLAEQPQPSRRFVRELVLRGHLTPFQARRVWAGRGRSLRLGNYVVLDELGRGGMGVVLKAVHRHMGRRVAIKVLSSSVTQDADAVARFRREVVAAAQLTHPNVVSAFDAGEFDGQPMLVMELVEGQDLSSLVKSKGPLPIDRAVSCILQAARGLSYAHQRGIIHRDIKPANLLHKKCGTVKVLDMGIARFSQEGPARTLTELTVSGIVLGSVDYMSPEQALSTKSADVRSDIYSLGMTLYFLLIGQAAYPRESMLARLMAHANDPVPSLREHRAEVSPNIDAVFRRMVAKRPQDRHQSMAEVVADLETCQNDQTRTSLTDSSNSRIADDAALDRFLNQLSQDLSGEPSDGMNPRESQSRNHRVLWRQSPQAALDQLVGLLLRSLRSMSPVRSKRSSRNSKR